MKDYFYIDIQNQQHGPIAEDKLLAAGVQRHTLVWCKGMADWMPAETVAELRALFDEAERQQTEAQAEPGPQAQHSPNEPPPYQQPYTQQPYNNAYNNRPPFPDTYLVWAVLATICCCLPLGIVAIIKANQVSGLFYRGLYDEAYLAAEDAKKWSIAAFLVGIITCCGGGFINLFNGCDGLLNGFIYSWNNNLINY